MPRAAAIAAVLLALLLLAPVAGATHPLVPKPNSEMLQGGSGFALVVNHTYRVHAGYEGSEVVDQPKTPTQPYYYRLDENGMRFDGALASSGALSFDPFWRGVSFGSGEVLRQGSFAYAATMREIEKREKLEGGVETTEDVATESECRRQVGGGPGERMGQPMPLSAKAALLDEGRTVRVTLHMPPLGPDPWEPCFSRASGTRYGESFRDEMDVSPMFAFFYANALFNEPPGSWSKDDDMGFTFSVPADQGSAVFTRTLRYTLPDSDADEYGGLCPRPLDPHRGSGECVAEATLEVRIFVDRCALVLESYKTHVKTVQEIPPPQKGAPEAWVIAWGKEAAKEIASLLSDARAYLLICGDDLPEGDFEAIGRVMRMYRDALVEIAQTVGLTERGTAALMSAERQLQLLGMGDEGSTTFGDGEVRDGRFFINVHSPVSIHAWAPDGRHVGWNDATGAPDVEIEGATYEGQPGGYQRISLPSGFYKVGVDELQAGSYVLNVSWEAEGVAGSEEFLSTSEEGRSALTHFAFDRVDENGTLVLDSFPLQRVQTPTAWRFVDPIVPRGGGSGGEPAPTAPTGQPTRTGATTPPGGATPPTTTSPPPGAAPFLEGEGAAGDAETPAWGAAAAFAALAVAVALRRRRRA